LWSSFYFFTLLPCHDALVFVMILSWCTNFCHDLVTMHRFHEHVWNCYIEWKPNFLVYFYIVIIKLEKMKCTSILSKSSTWTIFVMQQGDYGFSTTKLICVAILGFNFQAYHIDNIYICHFTISCGCHKCKSTSPVLEITLWISYQAMYKIDSAFSSVH
jgi:hypothetical protein